MTSNSELEEVNQHITYLKEQEEKMEDQKSEIDTTINSLSELNENEEEKEMLCPLSTGIFVKTKVKKVDDVIVNVGSNVCVNKSVDDSIEMLKKQKEEVKNYHKEIKEKLEQLYQKKKELEG